MTALTTTWTEQSTVAYTAGTLASYTDCISYVEGKLNRGTLSSITIPTSAQVQEELIRAKEELCELFGFTWQRKYSYADCVAAQYRYALPADFFGGSFSLRDMTNNKKLDRIDPYKFDLKWPDVSAESSGKPSAFTIKDRELWLNKPSGSTYRLEAEYDRTGDDSTATDISYIPEILRFRMCDFALWQSYLILHMEEKAAYYENQWVQGMRKSKRGDKMKKFAATGFQALTWQQEYNAKFNQAS